MLNICFHLKVHILGSAWVGFSHKLAVEVHCNHDMAITVSGEKHYYSCKRLVLESARSEDYGSGISI